MRTTKKLLILLSILLCLPLNIANATAPKIVVSIKPIHSITTHITEGITEPTLLLPDGASPHTFLLKPSHRKLIQEADLLIWVGENCETHLEKIIAQNKSKALTLMSYPTLKILTLRKDRDFSLIHNPIPQPKHRHEHEHEHAHEHHDHSHASNEDAHIWLSVENAKLITTAILERLIQLDPAHEKEYRHNAEQYQKQLDTLKETLAQRFAQTKPAPFLVFHDAYQYFETEFGISSIGSILINPHVPLTARALSHIQSLIEKYHVHCIYYEPEYSYQALKPILSKQGLQLLELDHLGVRQAKGLGCYEKMMLALSTQLIACKNSHS
ncbi:zinc ABC transporter substrate-binding protein [Candidatus Berkiella cookevillensis]|uniref:High-affinity zinc uptake system protein ZnuA n=1 Tax=Candidatus Berkiella cookevillensis TaxID=437022 RepID=A0A0Q9YIG8_9GAMM|nr:zinc ABC transporter substrate-binding protein [Candidatus Berkiella cookevillensis]MCS5707461.1 zinc ABC transporter substrate-binding protein [Candidatus Berkiella cookevillensis]